MNQLIAFYSKVLDPDLNANMTEEQQKMYLGKFSQDYRNILLRYQPSKRIEEAFRQQYNHFVQSKKMFHIK